MAARASIKPKESEPKSASLEDRIRLRAYELYLQRDSQDGSDLDDWLRAEAEITETVQQEHRTEAEISASRK